MNDKNKYKGEEGVFWDDLNSRIFILDKKMKKLFYNMDTHKKREIYVYDITYKQVKHKETAIIMHDQVTRLGDL